MLRIVHHTSDQLVLRDHRPYASLTAWVIVVSSTLALVIFAAQTVELIGRNPSALQLMTATLFLLLGVGFIVFSLFLLANFTGGTTCTLDRNDATLVIRRIEWFRPREISYPIYAVARVDIERNKDVQAFGIFVVLQSSERIPLAALPLIEQQHVQELVQVLRDFLRG
jgi:hypothetical protein